MIWFGSLPNPNDLKSNKAQRESPGPGYHRLDSAPARAISSGFGRIAQMTNTTERKPASLCALRTELDRKKQDFMTLLAEAKKGNLYEAEIEIRAALYINALSQYRVAMFSAGLSGQDHSRR